MRKRERKNPAEEKKMCIREPYYYDDDDDEDDVKDIEKAKERGGSATSLAFPLSYE